MTWLKIDHMFGTLLDVQFVHLVRSDLTLGDLPCRAGNNAVRDLDSGARPAGLHTTRSGNLSGAPGETGQV